MFPFLSVAARVHGLPRMLAVHSSESPDILQVAILQNVVYNAVRMLRRGCAEPVGEILRARLRVLLHRHAVMQRLLDV